MTEKNNNNIIVKSNPSIDSAIGYNGNLSVLIKNGNRTISKKAYHNMGHVKLFQFICNCLAGTFTETARPCRIRLYKANNPNSFDASTESDRSTWTDGDVVSSFIYADTTTVPNAPGDGTTTNAYQVTYHFRIPLAFIQDNIYKVALYSQIGSAFDDICASFFFTNSNETAWDPIIISNLRGNFSVIIEWTMTVSNKPAVSSSSETTDKATD